MDIKSIIRRGWVVFFLCFCLLPGLVYAQDGGPPAAEPTPTVDRLAAPPTVPAPNQADEGAQLFWLYCQPCHGDKGQGLTDEWRAQFPEEEQYCWQSGCHSEVGKDLPEYGFVLPTAVPAVIGEGSLEKFADTQQLFSYIRGAMPYEAPGRLTDEEYLAITAYIARAHGVWEGTPLNESNLVQLRLAPEGAGNIPAEPTAVEQRIIPSEQSSPGLSIIPLVLVGILVLVIIIGGGAWLWHQQEQ